MESRYQNVTRCHHTLAYSRCRWPILAAGSKSRAGATRLPTAVVWVSCGAVTRGNLHAASLLSSMHTADAHRGSWEEEEVVIWEVGRRYFHSAFTHTAEGERVYERSCT